MSEPELTKLQMDERKALTGDRAAILSVVSALRTYRIEADSLLTAFKELCRDHESQPEEFERAVRALEAGESEVAREPIPLEQIPQQGDQAEAEYRLRVVKSWLGSFPELREAITEHMATELQAKVTPLIESTMEEVVDKAFEMPTIDEAFEGLKVACAKFPEFKRRIQLWLVDQPIEGVAEQLAKEMGEFARDEMGATASDIDEAIARDREAQAMDQAKKLARFCDEHGIDLELVLRSIYP